MRKHICTPALILLAAIFCSCQELPINYSRAASWLISENKNRPPLIINVQVDRVSGWDSLEKEIAALAPLYFWEEGFTLAADETEPVYIVDIQAREREFSLGWRTKRSLSVDVRVWAYEDAAEGIQFFNKKLPLAAGRVIATGELSFSSSETVGKMLSKAIKKAAKKLALVEKGK